jgi:AcrR family transcriptional regulator
MGLPQPTRQDRTRERREAIIAAAVEEFTAHGFAATRIDDIAHRAGVAKGTVFLHFSDKEALFEGMAQAVLTPWIEQVVATVPRSAVSVRATLETLLLSAVRELQGRRGDVIRLFLSEGLRFPRLAELYHREVLSPLLELIRGMLALAAERGELADQRIVAFPQLVGGPMVVGLLWHGLFERIEPLDVRGLIKTQLNRLFV